MPTTEAKPDQIDPAKDNLEDGTPPSATSSPPEVDTPSPVSRAAGSHSVNPDAEKPANGDDEPVDETPGEKIVPFKKPTRPRKPKPLTSDISKADAETLDADINKAIETFSKTVAEAYVALGVNLMKMQNNKGYAELGYNTWKEYLAAKRERIGKTYCSYVIKLAQAEGVSTYFDKITGAQLIEFSKMLPYAEIKPAIEANLVEIEGKSARDTRAIIAKYKEENLTKVESKAKRKPLLTWAEKLKNQYDKCETDADRAAFKAGIKAIAKSLKES